MLVWISWKWGVVFMAILLHTMDRDLASAPSYTATSIHQSYSEKTWKFSFQETFSTLFTTRTHTHTDQYNWLLMIWHYANVHCKEINLCKGFTILGRWPPAHQSHRDLTWRTDSGEQQRCAPSLKVRVHHLQRESVCVGKQIIFTTMTSMCLHHQHYRLKLEETFLLHL